MAFDDIQKKMMAAQLDNNNQKENSASQEDKKAEGITEIKIPKIAVKKEKTKPATYTLTPTNKAKLAYIASISGYSASAYISEIAQSGFSALSDDQKADFDKWRKKHNL